MPNLEEQLKKLNKFVTFEPGARKSYMDDLLCVIEYIINELKLKNIVFKELYKGYSFQGSYADNLKIKAPDEYDILLRLKLPKANLAQIAPDPSKPGYVFINIENILEEIPQYTTTHLEIFKELKKRSDSKQYLVQSEISSWFESMMGECLDGSKKELRVHDKIYFISYHKAGPAHNLVIHDNSISPKKISIDLVPAFIFSEDQWVAKRSIDEYRLLAYNLKWVAVPKPKKHYEKGDKPNISFISSFTDTERSIIANKNQLKNCIRLLKKLRDNMNIQNLKSYFIKTVFLWEDEKVDPKFWNQSSSFIFLHMLEILIGYIEKGDLPFFWDSSQNMIGDLSYNQKKTMADQLRSSQKKIKKYIEIKNPPNIYGIFLSSDEIEAMEDGKSLEEKCENDQNELSILSPDLSTGLGIGLAVGGVAYLCYELGKAFRNRRDN